MTAAAIPFFLAWLAIASGFTALSKDCAPLNPARRLAEWVNFLQQLEDQKKGGGGIQFVCWADPPPK